MRCLSCGEDAHEDNPWGAWCDPCGGVAIRPGILIFRHVATVDGPGGRFPIVFDLSTSDYAYMHKERRLPTKDPTSLEGFKRSPLRISHGTLDAMIAVSYPDVKAEDPTIAETQPELSAAPSATPEEIAIVQLRPGI